MSFVFVAKKGRNKNSLGIGFRLEGKEYRIYLGQKYSKEYAKKLSSYIDDLVSSKITGCRHSKIIQAFIDELKPDLREKLQNVGLIDKRIDCSPINVWEFFIENILKGKESTKKSYYNARDRFIKFFEECKDIAEIEEEDCIEFKKWLQNESYAKATIAMTIQRTKTVFKWALLNELIKKNPFDCLKRGSQSNKKKEFYISLDCYKLLLDKCQSQEWRVLLALCRIGGLRNPSETMSLRWEDIDWKNKKIKITSPKTEHHEGHSERIIPLWDLLSKELKALYCIKDNKNNYFVLNELREKITSLRYELKKIIISAGLKQWPRIFHNLRGSRSNELFERNSSYVASEWMGHSPSVAKKHYLHVTDEQIISSIEQEKEEK